MTPPRIARGTKCRIFLSIAIVGYVMFSLFLFHKTQSKLGEVKRRADKCHQQQESLAAQLQVIFEYKIRLEKSVQQEKADHRHSREELLAQIDEERTKRFKEVLEANNKLSSLQQHYKLLQGQHEDLAEECNKARATGNKAAEIQARAEAQLQQLRASREKEAELLKKQVFQLHSKNEHLQKQVQSSINTANQAKEDLQRCLNSLNKASVAPPAAQGHLVSPPASLSSAFVSMPSQLPVAAAVHSPEKNQMSSISTLNSSVSLINKDGDNSNVAPVPGPPEEVMAVKSSTHIESGQMKSNGQPVPAGIVPFHDRANAFQQVLPLPLAKFQYARKKAPAMEESHQIAQPLAAAKMKPLPHLYNLINQNNENDADGKAVAAPPPNHKLPWKGTGEEEEEGDSQGFRQYHAPDNYKEDEGELDDRGVPVVAPGGHWPVNRHGENDNHEDMQLEDMDEDDDDVDQIDYNNDGANNDAAKHKQARKLPAAGKHESVMVNPKK